MISDKFFLIINLFIFAILIIHRCYFFTGCLEDYSKLSLKYDLVETKKNSKELESISIYNYIFAIIIAIILGIFIFVSAFIDSYNKSGQE